MKRRFSFAQFFRSLVRVKMPDFELQNTFSGGRKPKMSRFNDPRVDRPDWNFKYAFTFDPVKGIFSFFLRDF
jgi:hypothetical protein